MQNNKTRLAFMASVLAIPLMANAHGRIDGIAIQKTGKGVEVQIEGKDLDDPIAMFTNSNTVFSLEFSAKLLSKPSKSQVWINGLQTIQTTQLSSSPMRVRMQFRFQAGMKADVTKTGTGISLQFNPEDVSLGGIVTKVSNASNKNLLMGLAAQPFAVSQKLAPHVTDHTKSTHATKTAPAKSTPKQSGHEKATPVKVASTKPATKAPATTSTYKVPAAPTKQVSASAGSSEGRVTLDVVDTNVVFILKSLAQQTGSNIVTSPDVTGKLSVRLNNVTVKEALNLVTSLSGLRFAQVGRTYVVTTNAKFMETLRNVQGGKENVSVSRVVPIFSGQGNQIKVAVLKSVPPENSAGQFELVLPSEKASVASSQKVGKDSTKSAEDKDGVVVSTQSDETARDTYMMVIGSPGRLDEIEQLIRGIDTQLCAAIGVRVPESTSSVTETYNVRGGKAVDLVEAIAGKGKTSIGSVEIFCTPSNSSSQQSVVLKGRQDEVQSVLKALQQLDADEAMLSKEFKMLELQYTDPRSMRELIVSQVPGISCVIAPSGVMNQAAYERDAIRTQSQQRGADKQSQQAALDAQAAAAGGAAGAGGAGGAAGAAGGAAGAAGGAGGAAGGAAGVSTANADTGITLPFAGLEPNAFSMKLILRGSKEQIDAAMELVKQTDQAPKQVSLEMRVMEISREELLRLGINWQLFTSGAIKTITMSNPQSSPSNKIGISVQGRDVSGDVGATLDSISNGNRLVSRPNLLCNDGRTSEVFVGDAIRYIESIQSTQNGVSVTTGTVRAGVRLAAFPRIGGDGSINLDLRTAVTYLKEFKQVPQIGGELPQTSERTGQNTITLRDGETFAIGGLIQEQDRKNLSGLPILKDLPFFGQFFRRTSTDKIRTELVIFVTAKMVKVNQPTETKDLPMNPESKILNEYDKSQQKSSVTTTNSSNNSSKNNKKNGGKN